jgi:hypothetical protein
MSNAAPIAFGYRLQPVSPAHVGALHLADLLHVIHRDKEVTLADVITAARLLSIDGTEQAIMAELSTMRITWHERWTVIRSLLSKKYLFRNTLALALHLKAAARDSITIIETKDQQDGK